MDFRFETANREGKYVISLFGEFDLAAAETLPDWGVSMDSHRSVEVDLSGLTFMDSTGLREILRLQHQVEGEGRTLLVRSVEGSRVDQLFDLTGLRDRFTFVSD